MTFLYKCGLFYLTKFTELNFKEVVITFGVKHPFILNHALRNNKKDIFHSIENQHFNF